MSQALGTRDDLADLHRQDPELANRFTGLRNQLDEPGHAPPATHARAGVTAVPVSAAPAAERRRRLADQLTATLAEIRALDGFGSFGLPPATEDLLAQAAPGPVVTFNVSTHRSDALLLTSSGITVVELPTLTQDALISQVNAFHQALDTATHAVGHADRMAAQNALALILGWLWDAAAEPVLDALGYRSRPASDGEWPHVWWAPGGMLSLLPIHAAGHHGEPEANGHAPRTVMDRVISSYTPTIRALRYARQHARESGVPGRALIIAMPTTPGLPGSAALPGVAAEVAQVGALLPEPIILTEPATLGTEPASESSSLPTRANVLAHLPGSSIAHFACHGESDPSDPSNSRLLLHDHETAPLTVTSLASVNHDQLQLVYLSACRTAITPATELLDEAIHLTSAFQLAGSRHVIGTLWEIGDATAADIATAFYAGLHTDFGTLDTGGAAPALHHAVRAARDTNPTMPSLWAAYLHAGA